MREKKYELVGEPNEHGLRRIRALLDIPKHGVKAGDLGGWIEGEKNLSHRGSAWVGGEARVFGAARVCGDARVCGEARVYGEAKVYGEARVGGAADYIVFKNWWSSGRYFTWTRSDNMWTVGCFHGTGAELIEKAKKDSEISGREYARVVAYVEEIIADENRAKEVGV